MKLVDKDEFISVCREIYARKGADAHELHFSLNDVINNINGLTCFDTDAVSKALEKQIPMKVIIRNKALNCWLCPNCQKYIKSFDIYCERCGQRLDWSEEQ